MCSFNVISMNIQFQIMTMTFQGTDTFEFIVFVQEIAGKRATLEDVLYSVGG